MHQNGFDPIDFDEDQYDEESDELADTIGQCGWDLSRGIDRIIEAITDFDPELSAVCLSEFGESVPRAASEAIAAYFELTELYALDPGLYATGWPAGGLADPPADLDSSRWPTVPRTGVRKGVRAIVAQTAACTGALSGLSRWTGELLDAMIGWYDDENPTEAAAVVAINILGVKARVDGIVALWQDSVIRPHRKLAATQKGLHPPRFTRTFLDGVLVGGEVR